MQYLWEIAQPFGLRFRAENQYRSSDASFVGAALCCEEAGTANRQALSAWPLRSTRLLLQNLAEPMSHVLFYESGQAREEAHAVYSGLTRSEGRRAPATSFSTALLAATMPKVAVTIITAPKPPAQSNRTPSPTKLFCRQTLPSPLG